MSIPANTAQIPDYRGGYRLFQWWWRFDGCIENIQNAAVSMRQFDSAPGRRVVMKASRSTSICEMMPYADNADSRLT